MIQWPCLFKLDGDAELMFIATQGELTKELEALIWDNSDHLIDSNGQCFRITQVNEEYAFEPFGRELTLQMVTELIQEHEFSKAQMCLTKIQFRTVKQAVLSLAYESEMATTDIRTS
tara:strand:+ start:225 stop:575 length:351 start_codon:yes stop_codon:yes gene_type:complete